MHVQPIMASPLLLELTFIVLSAIFAITHTLPALRYILRYILAGILRFCRLLLEAILFFDTNPIPPEERPRTVRVKPRPFKQRRDLDATSNDWIAGLQLAGDGLTWVWEHWDDIKIGLRRLFLFLKEKTSILYSRLFRKQLTTYATNAV